MVQQVTITAESPVSLKPLVEGAIEGELQILEFGIARTRERLAAFERQFGMTTEEFQRRFNGTDLKETLDFIDWSGEIKMLALLESKYETLRGAKIS